MWVSRSSKGEFTGCLFESRQVRCAARDQRLRVSSKGASGAIGRTSIAVEAHRSENQFVGPADDRGVVVDLGGHTPGVVGWPYACQGPGLDPRVTDLLSIGRSTEAMRHRRGLHGGRCCVAFVATAGISRSIQGSSIGIAELVVQ